MTRRQTLVALAVVAAIAVAVPAIAAVDNADFKRISQELRKLTHNAQKKANKALKLARKAQGPGPAGQNGATGPAGSAGLGGSTAFDQTAGPDSTGDDTQFVDLGGPSVNVTVPASGSIQVTASAVIGEDSGGAALFEDGAPMPGQADFCQTNAAGPPLFVSPDLAGSGAPPFEWGTPASTGFACGSSGPPGPVLFNTTPGPHTYELLYTYCGCDPPPAEATFENRKLWVTTLP